MRGSSSALDHTQGYKAVMVRVGWILHHSDSVRTLCMSTIDRFDQPSSLLRTHLLKPQSRIQTWLALLLYTTNC